ncbi:tachylectin-related carbohydrate-binding protein [Streptomyces sp. NPDC049602]|uniref:tachylectin-related carbohydrate-binding protein n=1 Tax=Streptomyces sp. NPDC049602 TaxID=3155504 RepID=UPI00343E8AF0
MRHTTRTFLVAASALLAALIPPAAGGATAFAAPLTAPASTTPPVTATTTPPVTASTPAPGTVVQRGGTLSVPSGEEGPVTTYFGAALPAGTTGTVKARLFLSNIDRPTDGTIPYELYYTRWSCSVNGGAFVACPYGREGFVMPETEAAPFLTYAVRVDAGSYAARDQLVFGSFDVTGTAGRRIATGEAGFVFVPGTPEAEYRTVLHARDRGGVLWQYEGTGKPATPFKPRQRVGGGWGDYTALTRLGPPTADGRGDLVARDRDGALWYYRGSGDLSAPFWPRVRIGGGWNAYTSLTGTSGGLLARDRDGVLWHYPRAAGAPLSAPFAPRARVGGGWNAYTALTARGDTVLARDTSGVLWEYRKSYSPDPAVPLEPRRRVGGGWNVYTALAGTGDLGFHSSPDLLARDRDGDLWMYQGPTRTAAGWGWNIYDTLL